MPKKAIVFLSGGLDSTTCLAIAKAEGYACYALTFDYGQRNRVEIERAEEIAKTLDVIEHRIFKIDLQQWKGSALTDHALNVPHERSDTVPITYVPARNTIFLSLALAWAETLEVSDIFFGANHDDFVNYPDCRPAYLEAFTQMANLATRQGEFHIHTPLLDCSKADIIRQGLELGVDLDRTLSCYDPDIKGNPCGHCDACYFRARGFRDAGLGNH